MTRVLLIKNEECLYFEQSSSISRFQNTSIMLIYLCFLVFDDLYFGLAEQCWVEVVPVLRGGFGFFAIRLCSVIVITGGPR